MVCVPIYEYFVENDCRTTAAAKSRSSPLAALTFNRALAHNPNTPNKSFLVLPKHQFREILA
jgi:hypothetical protein